MQELFTEEEIGSAAFPDQETRNRAAPLGNPKIDRSRDFVFSAGSREPIQKANSRLILLDALRGGASLLVIAHHACDAWTTTVPMEWPFYEIVRFLRFGIGIDLFFVLSGLCLMYTLLRDQSLDDIRIDTNRFYRKRILRIIPPYYTALILCLLLRVGEGNAQIHPDSFFWYLSAHLLFLHNLFPQTVSSINTTYWSLAVEWQWYLIFPVVIMGIRRWGIPTMLTGALLIALLWNTASLNFAQYCQTFALMGVLPVRLVEIAAGMVGAIWLVFPPRNRVSTALMCGLLAFWFITMRPEGVLPSIWQALFRSIILVSGIVVLHAIIDRFPRCKSVLKPFSVLGAVSYSVYLLHEPLLLITAPYVQKAHLTAEAKILLFVLLVVPVLYSLGWLYQKGFDYLYQRFWQKQPRENTAK